MLAPPPTSKRHSVERWYRAAGDPETAGEGPVVAESPATTPSEVAFARILAANARYAQIIADLRRGIRAALDNAETGHTRDAIVILQALSAPPKKADPPDRQLQRDGNVPPVDQSR